ncbi:MAG TPA: hypothetical protein VEL28_09345 [Candidatus Binatia bacterium]|nr:hypothetical protein [Candidatus Binatia bacterium]
MPSRTKLAWAAALAVAGAIAFGTFSFRSEVASIQRRQSADAMRCNQVVQEARALVERGRATEVAGSDFCRAHQDLERALSLVQQAQRLCRKALDQDPLMTSNAAVARLTASRDELKKKCYEAAEVSDREAGRPSEK